MKKYIFCLQFFLVSFLTRAQEGGSTEFNVADKIAINNVIDAYGFYWDTNQLDKFLSLFTDDAIGVIYNNETKVTFNIKSEEQIKNDQERMNYFIERGMQRRHMMANTLLLECTYKEASLLKYMTLLTTNQKTKTEFVTPILYHFKLKKINGVWKITFREIKADKPLDKPLEVSSHKKKKSRKGMLLPTRSNKKLNKNRMDYKKGIN